MDIDRKLPEHPTRVRRVCRLGDPCCLSRLSGCSLGPESPTTRRQFPYARAPPPAILPVRRDRALLADGLRPSRRRELALRRGRRRAADRSVARLPGVLVRHGGDRSNSSPRPVFGVVAPDTRGYNLSSKPESFESYAVDLLADDIRGLIGELGAESAIWSVTTGTEASPGRYVDERPRGWSTDSPSSTRAHPRRLSEGLTTPEPASEVLVLLLLRGTGIARGRRARRRDWHFFRHFLQTRTRRKRPGDRAVRRGAVAAGVPRPG